MPTAPSWREGGGWSYLLRGWQGARFQYSFLFTWGGVLTPRRRGRRVIWGGKEEERLAGGDAKQHLVPRCGQCLYWGGGGNLRSCSPFGGGDSLGRVNLRGHRGLGAQIWMPQLYLPVTASSGPGGGPGSGGSCPPSWASERGRQAPRWAGTSNSRRPPAW